MTGTAEKDELRARMRQARAALDPGMRRRKAAAVEDRLFSVPTVAAGGSVLLFYSFGSEIGTAGMAERVLAGGKRLLLPYLDAEGMEAAEVRPGEALVASAYGPKEPVRRVAVDPAAVDVVVTPGLAFDRHGHRLGYGGGHYDRYLGRLGSHALRVGIAFAEQVIDRVPAGPRDQPVHLVVTDAEAIDCRRGPRPVAPDR
ncbi:MAG: 5-formyltetrahydrofolate cyclo-ligase [Actinomycetota bacterium]